MQQSHFADSPQYGHVQLQSSMELPHLSQRALNGEFRFDIGLLSERLKVATEWLKENPVTKGLSLGYYGASTSATAALIAATKFPEDVSAIVSRGGRPDLAMQYLRKVKVSILFIVGEETLLCLI